MKWCLMSIFFEHAEIVSEVERESAAWLSEKKENGVEKEKFKREQKICIQIPSFNAGVNG